MPSLSKVGSEMLDGALPALDGSSLTGVGVDGVTSSADATAITIDSSENVAIGSTTGLATATHHTLQVGGDDTYQRLSLNNTGTGGNHWAIHSVNGAGGSAAGKFGVYLSPSWRMTIDASGNVGIGVTAPTQKLDVDGTVKASSIAFPASQSASADANTLDDYEEGTFSPTIQDNSLSDSESQVYHGNQSGVYTKVGRVVTCNGYMNINSSSLTGTDQCYLAGFPFTSRSSGTEQAVVSFGATGGWASNIVDTYGHVYGSLEGGGTTARIEVPNVQTGANQFTVATLSGGYFSFSVTYFV